MAERQILIDFAELETVEVSCKCGSSAVLPAERSLKGEGKCPSCEQSLLGAALAVKSLRDFISEAKKSGHGFKFRVAD
jgi:hypothetical protein